MEKETKKQRNEEFSWRFKKEGEKTRQARPLMTDNTVESEELASSQFRGEVGERK